jgi:UDP-N-acetylmuramoylalanine--D-glutamate ligase
VAAGNIGLPLSDAVRLDVEVVVAEVSSFQLRFTDSFHPAVAAWLNLAQDHLDWHPDLDAYAAAKARIWAFQTDKDVAVVNADDPVVMAWASEAPSRLVTFGLRAPADYGVEDGWLRGPEGRLSAVDDLARALPHDVANALAAAAAAVAAGATTDGVATALRGWRGLPHRVVLVTEADGVRWFDDSKATNPHATRAALAGFDSVVLIAGGRNKGLDLRPLRDAAGNVRAVVALGEAGPDVAQAFAGVRPVVEAETMDAAVRAAAELARPGDAVLLSPACASFDLYRSYAHRGDDFARAVRELVGER